jgi:leishmanolysin-like peptidase
LMRIICCCFFMLFYYNEVHCLIGTIDMKIYSFYLFKLTVTGSLNYMANGASLASLLGLTNHFYQHPQLTLDYGGFHFYNDRHLQNDIYQPLRIKFITEPLEKRRGQGFDYQIDEIINTVLPAVAGNWSKHLRVLPSQQYIPIFNDSCRDIFTNRKQAANLTTPIYVPNADLAIIVGGYESITTIDGAVVLCGNTSDALAHALLCQLDQYERPILGFINFCFGGSTSVAQPNTVNNVVQQSVQTFLNTTLLDNQVSSSLIDVATHEIGHVLAFSSSLFPYFKEPDGTPRTPRPFAITTQTCLNGQVLQTVFPSNTTVQILPSTGGRLSYHIVTPRVAQVVRNHFDCDTLMGARLATDDPDCIPSHWHERLFFNELMKPVYASASENVLTALTLALMEDSGFYQVDYRNSETMAYGLGKGCDFVLKECIVNEKVPDYGKGTFCSTPIEYDANYQLTFNSANSITCDVAHKDWIFCDIIDTATFPFQLLQSSNQSHQYFASKTLQTLQPAVESCPILGSMGLGRDCSVPDSSYRAFYAAESVGLGSRCVDTFTNSSQVQLNRPACFKIECDTSTRQVVLRFDSIGYICDYDWQVVQFANNGNPSYFMCPPRDVVCPEIFACPAYCSGRGACVYANISSSAATCKCFVGESSTAGCYPYVNDSGLSVPSPAPITAPPFVPGTRGFPAGSPIALNKPLPASPTQRPAIASSSASFMTIAAFLVANACNCFVLCAFLIV